MTSNYENKLYKDYEKLQNKYEEQATKLKYAIISQRIAEDAQARAEKSEAKK